jgi:hypothetical protein
MYNLYVLLGVYEKEDFLEVCERWQQIAQPEKLRQLAEVGEEAQQGKK